MTVIVSVLLGTGSFLWLLYCLPAGEFLFHSLYVQGRLIVSSRNDISTAWLAAYCHVIAGIQFSGVVDVLRQFLRIWLSHRYTTARRSKSSSANTCSARRSNDAGALHNPKGIRKYSNKPRWVVKAVFGMSDSHIDIWWNPDNKSMVEKILAQWRWSRISSVLGRGCASFLLTLLSLR